jgi:uncharacterized membrane protein (DUF4010 family)
LTVESSFNIDPAIMSLAVAIGIGLLVGTERERRKGEGPDRAAAGVRTFTLASLVGAVGFAIGDTVLLAVVIGGMFLITALSYASRQDDDPGLTTEIALVVTALLGALAMTRPALAAGLAVAVTIMLNARSALHEFVRSVLDEDEVRDALIFAAATLIVLPILPDRPIGPFDALDPRAIWIIVILVMTISSLGHVAVRALGPRYGLPIAGLASGFVSSTATIAAMGARAKKMPGQLWPAAAGAILSSVATIVQMALLLAATNLETLSRMTAPLLFAGTAAILYGVLFAALAWRSRLTEAPERGHAFSLWTALGFAALLSAVLLLARALENSFGAQGVAVAAGAAGLADTHSAAISVATLVGAGKLGAAEAELPILIALSTNTISKFVVGLSGGAGFALCVVPGLFFVVGAAWAGWWAFPWAE